MQRACAWLAIVIMGLGLAGCSDSNAPLEPIPTALSDRWILFTENSSANPGYTAIYAILPDGRGMRQVTPGLSRGAYGARWSRDGEQIAYVAIGMTPQTWVMRRDSSNAHQIGALADCASGFSGFSWSPTGDRVIELCEPSNAWVINLADGTKYSLNQLWGRHVSEADWSPTGDRIQYTRPGLAGNDTYVANLDGSGDVLVASSAGEPKWSPDATRAVLASRGAVFVANADGSGLFQLTSPVSPLSDDAPAWSHDGTQVVFVRTPFGTSNSVLHVINPDGSGDKAITPDSVRATGPDW